MTLENKLALVTGAASGIGRAVALNLAAAGARVAAVDRNPDGLKETLDLIGDGPAAGPALGFEVDLADPARILRLRDDLIAQAGLPDVIVNAAGFDRVEPFLANDDALWTNLVTVNFLGPVRLCHAFLTSIVEAERTVKIVNIASDAGRVGSTGETVYAGTKGAIIAFTKSLAREMARHRINVNCVCPGPTDTPLFHTLPDKIQTGLERGIPFRRLATPGEIADAVAFFASDAAGYVTGQTLSVSGGLTMA
ncbi:MAG TPA: SDR family NAD(P)-dependent oxidoreductase [Streptosporangiaceae bacterium]|nr:SDR family NAD(P)-dependent oxidoreductase [Streptosporangiaceae bacterium]